MQLCYQYVDLITFYCSSLQLNFQFSLLQSLNAVVLRWKLHHCNSMQAQLIWNIHTHTPTHTPPHTHKKKPKKSKQNQPTKQTKHHPYPPPPPPKKKKKYWVFMVVGGYYWNFGEVRISKKMGVMGVTPSKTHRFLPICKRHYGNFCKFSWFCYFFLDFFHIDFFFWGGGEGAPHPSHPPRAYAPVSGKSLLGFDKIIYIFKKRQTRWISSVMFYRRSGYG